MKIAIHSSKISYSERWIAYCKENQIPYKIVDCYKSDIIKQLEDCDGLMWHFYQASPKDYLCAKQILYSVQASGKKVFPDFNTCWHFDDKVGQKYLLEAIGAPLVPSYVFYSKAEALQWANQTSFPKVFKLRGGASSDNVRLVRSKKQADRLIKKAFGSGFRRFDPWSGLKERWRRIKLGKSNFTELFEALGHFFIKTDFEKIIGNDRGYVYFQDFIDDCTFDIRVKVVDDKCWVYKRLVREKDFRASGSDNQVFSPEGVPLEVIEIAFSISRKLQLRSVAFDFLLSTDNRPLLLEISYGFGYKEEQHYAYWDSDMNWHEGAFNPFGWMVESLIKDIKNS
jgi:glutathione synthase/RimK-type ligase-like ATP-grasp enzyme